MKSKRNLALPLIAAALSLLAACKSKPASPLQTTPENNRGGKFGLRAPLGLELTSSTFYIPDDNPLSEEKVALGKRLFFDKSLSIDGTVSCASCHVPEKAFSDPNQFSIGIKGRTGTRQSPTLINRVFSQAQFWDGRARNLEQQAAIPLTNPVEMGNPNVDSVIKRLRRDESYNTAFAKAFPQGPAISAQHLGMAIASFERTILAGNSPFDRFTNGDKNAITESALRGYRLFFGKATCSQCHVSFNFTDELYHNLGVGSLAEKPDPGRFIVAKTEGSQGAMKTPTMRELVHTAPYMSDGSLKTLEEVIDFYDKGCQPNKWLSPKIKPLNLSAEEKRDLLEFLKSLSGEVTWYGKQND
jgi:cytochrome c peroxidase